MATGLQPGHITTSATTVDNPTAVTESSSSSTMYDAITSSSSHVTQPPVDSTSHNTPSPAGNAGGGNSTQMTSGLLDVQKTTSPVLTPVPTNKTSNEKIILGDKHSDVGKIFNTYL